MNTQENPQRLFFALWPDDKVRNAIAATVRKATQHHQGKIIRTDNLHLTLAFLGNVQHAHRECVEAMAESILMTPFSLCLEHVGIFHRPKVLWLGVKQEPDVLVQLVASLENAARDCGIKLENKCFKPHVSLMRKVNQLQEFEVEPVHWDVNEFCLVESITQAEGVVYRVVKKW